MSNIPYISYIYPHIYSTSNSPVPSLRHKLNLMNATKSLAAIMSGPGRPARLPVSSIQFKGENSITKSKHLLPPIATPRNQTRPFIGQLPFPREKKKSLSLR
ncbi:hypothetical protein ACMFMG_003005 [Clarireedia jacksonii]